MKVLLAGDSTVADQPREAGQNPGLCYCGWGQMLHRFFNGVNVRNFAVSGYTVNDFREKGEYEELLAELCENDYAFFQFGHNDQKRPELRAEFEYKAALVRYAAEIRERGGIPVFVTSAARNTWSGHDNGYLDLLFHYADAMKRAAYEVNAPILDLHAESMKWIKTLGREGAKRYFYPGDYTHPNDFGGHKWATMIAGLILNNGHKDLDGLRAFVKPVSQWDAFDIAEDAADPVTGWLFPPKPRTDFAQWKDMEGKLTYADALKMAREGYGWFVAHNPGAPQAELDYICAAENGYLPEGFPATGWDGIISGDMFGKLMKLSCGGRNSIPPCAAELQAAAETGKDAVPFALELERRTTGAVLGGTENTPEGA